MNKKKEGRKYFVLHLGISLLIGVLVAFLLYHYTKADANLSFAVGMGVLTIYSQIAAFTRYSEQENRFQKEKNALVAKLAIGIIDRSTSDIDSERELEATKFKHAMRSIVNLLPDINTFYDNQVMQKSKSKIDVFLGSLISSPKKISNSQIKRMNNMLVTLREELQKMT